MPTLPTPGYAALAHIPGISRWSVSAATTLRLLADPVRFTSGCIEAFGPVYRTNTMGTWNVAMIGPEANELVLVNKDSLFSSEQGWNPLLERLFPRGLMLMDGDEHRRHRKTLSVAFKPDALRHYFEQLDAGARSGIARWPADLELYPAIKALTLDLAATSFLGVGLGPDADALNQAFVEMLQASVAVIRHPVPGTQMWRGVRGRARLAAFFAREIPERRGRSDGDFFTRFCNATDDDGRPLTDGEVIDHMAFLLLAAHDTLTSSLTSVAYFLALDPAWQDRARDEIRSRPLGFDRLGEFEAIEMVFKEAMRINAPVPVLPRRALRDFEILGHRVPAGTQVSAHPLATHRLPALWPDPERFDPSRFAPENARGRPKYAWVPFGAGAHMCLGLQFAYLQAKVFLYRLLERHRLVLPAGYRCDFQMFPMPKPRDGLPIRLEPA